MATAYEITPYVARGTRKAHCIVRCPSNDGWKTRAARLAEALKGRWTHRSGGYVMSVTKAARFEELYAAGWDGEFMTAKLVAPNGETK